MKLETKLKKWTLSKWRKELWKVFSEYVRKRDDGQCYTCNTKKHWKEMQAGHYRTGATCNLDLYFDERNVHTQCYRCNINLSGNWREYQSRMHREYGKEIDTVFDVMNQKTPKWDKRDYAQKIEEFKSKL